ALKKCNTTILTSFSRAIDNNKVTGRIKNQVVTTYSNSNLSFARLLTLTKSWRRTLRCIHQSKRASLFLNCSLPMLVARPSNSLNAFGWAWPSLLILMTTFRSAAHYEHHETRQNICPKNKADVIFLIDSSTSVDRENFTKLLHVISGTVQLMNVGANETRIGVTKFTGSPVTEFSLNDFDNREEILETILNVRYVAGVTHLGAAIQYVTDREFIHSKDEPSVKQWLPKKRLNTMIEKGIYNQHAEGHEKPPTMSPLTAIHCYAEFVSTPKNLLKGDRADVANVMAIMSDGLAQDDVIQPSAIARSKRIEFVAVAIGKFYGKEQLMDITGGRRDRILRFQHVNKTVDISQQLHDAIMKSVQEQCSQNITSWEMFTTATEKTTTSSTWSPHFPSPQNGDIKTNCKDGSMEVTISKTPPYRGWLLVKGHQKKKGCFWDYTNNKEDNIRTTIDYNTCQAETRRSTNPDGVFVSMTILLLKHPLLFQHVDRAYRLQCFYGGKETLVNRELQIEELSTIKTLEKTIEKPDCVYTIRRDTVNGPIVKFATLGMDIVHRWECESPERDGENVYAMHVHSCYIKSETQEQVMVIDENGCPVEHSPIQKISYSPNQLLVSAKAPVVTLPDAGVVQFHCQVSLCLRHEQSCLQLTPPKCNSRTRSARNLLVVNGTNGRHLVRRDTIDLSSPMLFVLDFNEFHSNQPEQLKNVNMKPIPGQLDFICWSLWKYVITAVLTGTFLTVNAVVTFHKIRKC
ncbi:hypothetical protein M514_04522, partial [Trichuris suis]